MNNVRRISNYWTDILVVMQDQWDPWPGAANIVRVVWCLRDDGAILWPCYGQLVDVGTRKEELAPLVPL